MSIATLNTRSLHKHIDDVIQDEDIMDNMVICFQECHLINPPTNTALCKFNFSLAYSVHGVITCIDKSIQTEITKTYCNNKIEIIITNLYFQQPICILNLYIAPLTPLSTIIESITIARMESKQDNCILVIIGDFNIDMCTNNKKCRLLIDHMKTLQLQEITHKLCLQKKRII